MPKPSNQSKYFPTKHFGTDQAEDATWLDDSCPNQSTATLSGFTTAVAADSGLMTTAPSPQEYIDAANAVYFQNILSNPPGLTPLVGIPVPQQGPLSGQTDLSELELPTAGFYAQAYEDNSGNIIIAYDSSVLDFSINTPYADGSRSDDLDLLLGQTPTKLFNQAVAFAQQVQKDYGSSHQIYVTGFSLGGAEAEDVAYEAANGALQAIAGGDTFGAPGLPGYLGVGGNLINYVDRGDPVGNYARDSELSIISALGDHYGSVQLVGSLTNASYIVSSLAVASVGGIEALPAFLLLLRASGETYHNIAQYVSDLPSLQQPTTEIPVTTNAEIAQELEQQGVLPPSIPPAPTAGPHPIVSAKATDFTLINTWLPLTLLFAGRKGPPEAAITLTTTIL